MTERLLTGALSINQTKNSPYHDRNRQAACLRGFLILLVLGIGCVISSPELKALSELMGYP